MNKKLLDEILSGVKNPDILTTIFENQEKYLKNMFVPPEELIPENIDEYEKEMSKNILLDHVCNNCVYSACEKQKDRYGTCSVWKGKSEFDISSVVFPVIRKIFPSK